MQFLRDRRVLLNDLIFLVFQIDEIFLNLRDQTDWEINWFLVVHLLLAVGNLILSGDMPHHRFTEWGGGIDLSNILAKERFLLEILFEHS